MTTHEARRPSAVATIINWAITLFLLSFVGVMLYLMWPMLLARIASAPPVTPPAPFLAPQSAPAIQSSHPALQATPLALPTASLEQISATSTAIYQATAQAVDAPPPNINTTGDSAPLVVEQKPSIRQGAGAHVPTAEPIVIPQSDEQTGSKAVVVNPQETHECRHGQVWIAEKGCKNP